MTGDGYSLTRTGKATLAVPLTAGVGRIRTPLRALVAVVISVLGCCWVDVVAIAQWLPVSVSERLWLLDGDAILATLSESGGCLDRQQLDAPTTDGRTVTRSTQTGLTTVMSR